MSETKNRAIRNAWGETNPGKHRSNNEDRIYCRPDEEIFIVADGMGGEAAGEVAAERAVEFIRKRLRRRSGTTVGRLREAIAGAGNEIFRLAESHSEWHGMACVLTAAIVDEGTVHIGHVGDTRIYKVRGGRMLKLTPDHSPVGIREDAGELTELEAMRHPRRNEVFRDLGSQLHNPDDEDFIDCLQAPFEEDSALLLCSDGLSDMLTSAEILETVLSHAGRPRECVSDLIARANAAGGKDNISVIVVEGEEFASASAANVSVGARQVSAPAGAAGSPKTSAASTSFARLRGRWAFLVYGLILGAFLTALLYWRPGVVAPNPVETQPAAARVLMVDPASMEYPTIADAMESAHAGDRIEIGPGEYEESIRLKDGVDIVARSPGKAILAFRRVIPGADAAIIADGITGAEVSGLVVKVERSAGLPLGIRIVDSSVNLTDLEISGALRAGISIDGDSSPSLVGCYIHSNVGPGIVISGNSTAHLTGNVVHANGLGKEHPGPGLSIVENANPDVRRNVFSGNGAGAIRLARPELRDLMMDNLFVGPGKAENAVVVEQAKR